MALDNDTYHPEPATSTHISPSGTGRRKPRAAWKLVVAADAPWHGLLYPTKGGGRHLIFNTPESLLRAIEDLTGWQHPPSSPRPRHN